MYKGMSIKILKVGIVVVVALLFLGCQRRKNSGEADCEIKEVKGIYKGVDNYGRKETNINNVASFKYVFEVNNKEIKHFLINEQCGNICRNNGEDVKVDYPIQNILKVGYEYKLIVENDIIIRGAYELNRQDSRFASRVEGVLGERTLENFLRIAMEPVGSTLYVYGGGWNWQDQGAGLSACTIGVSKDWELFFDEQDENYTYRDEFGKAENKNPSSSFYPYGGFNQYYYAGLDCSGFVGWALYNLMNSKNGSMGYVRKSTEFAKALAMEDGLGEWTKDTEGILKPGDIISIPGHVWISLGTCDDGSVVALESIPSFSRAGQPGGGVQISAIGANKSCEAFRLADHYMSKYYPEWYKRYETTLNNPDTWFDYTKGDAGRFSWKVTGKEAVMTDSKGFQNKTPKEVLEKLFEKDYN